MVLGDYVKKVGVVAKLDYDKAARNRKDSGNCCNGARIYGDYYCTRTHISCEVYLPENTDLSVESISANIIIAGRNAAIRAHTISGFVDLTMAPEFKGDLKLNNVTVTVYTNMATNIPARNTRTAANRITELVNGDREPMHLEVGCGDSCFRQ